MEKKKKKEVIYTKEAKANSYNAKRIKKVLISSLIILVVAGITISLIFAILYAKNK